MIGESDFDRGYREGWDRATELAPSPDSDAVAEMVEDALSGIGELVDRMANAIESEEFRDGFQAGVEAYKQQHS